MRQGMSADLSYDDNTTRDVLFTLLSENADTLAVKLTNELNTAVNLTSRIVRASSQHTTHSVCFNYNQNLLPVVNVRLQATPSGVWVLPWMTWVSLSVFAHADWEEALAHIITENWTDPTAVIHFHETFHGTKLVVTR